MKQRPAQSSATTSSSEFEKDSNGAPHNRAYDLVQSRSPSNAMLLGANVDPAENKDVGSCNYKDTVAVHTTFGQKHATIPFRFNSRRPRTTAGDRFLAAMRRKRRMLGHNENLRFRQLYKPPEPVAFMLVIVVGIAVTLLLTKSWPFYQ